MLICEEDHPAFIRCRSLIDGRRNAYVTLFKPA
ncbi:hypothetical protein BN439_0645 [Erwinia amylovora Ea644]|nr:hypothetical protein BN439_0645 [Erwinia amylovora Ea644]CCP05737.1 hypothetical protein BN440_0686 [Erwinia amylovora MR1]